ncbi:hypothetical protein VB780_22830 [Leptolyngbya sp. CCNP1308]|uniref:hypothetical protein n=1 Tax=Leptolyngbya sp. CCNP1308 TaxID=3110255 RepID=UPI002B21400A|nr:hypothetical protein [Leptolyngbya sp. CCNP1308]MEA5451432.1 hypothetical protein [Leptolyngbya sp. CCNP1308]
MFFQLPPSLPPADAVGTDPIIEIVAECKKGSRDCFPEDRVGALQTVVLDLKAVAIAALYVPKT